MIRFVRAAGKEAWVTTNGTLLGEAMIAGILDLLLTDPENVHIMHT